MSPTNLANVTHPVWPSSPSNMSAEVVANQLQLSDTLNITTLLSKFAHLDVPCTTADSLACQSVSHSHCHVGLGWCVCNHGYRTQLNATCTRALPDNFLGDILASWPFLPILVVFVIMFICLCLVLRLFSRARFRNQSRSIFVNPTALSVAQAHERRLSQLSQLSASGLRSAPRTPSHRSPSYSYRSTRGSNASNSYPPPNEMSPSAYDYSAINDSILLKAKSRSNSISSSKLLA